MKGSFEERCEVRFRRFPCRRDEGSTLHKPNNKIKNKSFLRSFFWFTMMEVADEAGFMKAKFFGG